MEEQWQDILLPRQTLEEMLGEEIAKQYRLRWGEDCVYMPVSSGTECLCTCGKVNPAGEVCAACGRMPAIPDRQELETLQAEATQRLESEAALRAQEEAERLQQEAELRKRRRRRVLTVCATVVGALAVVALAVWSVVSFAIPAYHYGQARKALEQKDYQLAHREFTLAGEYKDAEAYLRRFYTPELTVRTEAPRLRSFREYTYDSAGRVIKETGEQFMQDPQGVVVTDDHWVYVHQYDEAGRVVRSENAGGKREYSYDQRGDLYRAAVYNAEGEQQYAYTFVYRYDEENRLTQMAVCCKACAQPTGSFIQTDKYAYDEAGNMIFRQTTKEYPQKPSAGYVTTTRWRYDEQGRQLERTMEMKSDQNTVTNLTEEEYWTYDEAGKILTHTQKTEYAQDPANNTDWKETHTYNSRGFLTELLTEGCYPNAPRRNYTVRITQEYDMAGRRIRARQVVEYENPERQKDLASSRTEEMTYDLLGRVIKTVRTRNYAQLENNCVETELVEYGPDGVQKTVCTVTEQNGTVTEDRKDYNENGLLFSVVYEHGSGNTRQELTYAYFYYPEGEPMPSLELTDPIAQWMPVQLYG